MKTSLDFMKENTDSYDIVVVQNILSHFKRTDNVDFVPVFMDFLKQNVIPFMPDNGLLIINDIEYNGFRWVDTAKDVLSKNGKKVQIMYWGNYKNEGWISHKHDRTLFEYPIDMSNFEPLRGCTRTIQFLLRV